MGMENVLDCSFIVDANCASGFLVAAALSCGGTCFLKRMRHCDICTCCAPAKWNFCNAHGVEWLPARVIMRYVRNDEISNATIATADPTGSGRRNDRSKLKVVNSIGIARIAAAIPESANSPGKKIRQYAPGLTPHHYKESQRGPPRRSRLGWARRAMPVHV